MKKKTIYTRSAYCLEWGMNIFRKLEIDVQKVQTLLDMKDEELPLRMAVNVEYARQVSKFFNLISQNQCDHVKLNKLDLNTTNPIN